jgi:hypothetical protein
MLEVAAKKLETGETFKIPTSSEEPQSAQASAAETISADKSVEIH